MKSWKMVLLGSALIGMVSCDTDDDSTDNGGNFGSTDVSALSDSAQNGTWRITRFVDDGVDETSDFDGFTFVFNSDGSILAENGTESITGTWSIELDDDDRDEDDDADELEFDISFSSPDDFDDLSDDWYVLEYSNTRIRLAEDDDDDDDDDDDFLTFERI